MANVARKSAAQVEATDTPGMTDMSQALESVAAPVREMQENVRRATEKTVEDTRAAYERARLVAEETTTSLEKSYAAAARGVVEFNTRVVDALRANADANFDFARSLFSCKSASEAISLNSEHARKQFEAMSFQARDLATLVQKVADETFEPIKATLEKGLAVRV